MGGIPHQMAGVPECGTLRRADEMVGAETVYLFIGGYYRFFGSAFVAGIGGGSLFLSVVVLYDTGDYCPDVNLGRSGVRLALIGVHYLHGERDTALLYGNRRGVLV